MSAKIPTIRPEVRPQRSRRIATRAGELCGRRSVLWEELLSTADEARAEEIKAELTRLYQDENKLIRSLERRGGR